MNTKVIKFISWQVVVASFCGGLCTASWGTTISAHWLLLMQLLRSQYLYVLCSLATLPLVLRYMDS